MTSAVEQEIKDLIHANGRITFAQFMQSCLYSPRGGFYSSRSNRISAHFGTSSTSHPVFGVLIARQLEQMWKIMGQPSTFQVIEVGAGDGLLARSIVDAAQSTDAEFADAIYYVAADYVPGPVQLSEGAPGLWEPALSSSPSTPPDTGFVIQRVKTEGLRAFRDVVGCILSNELVDNFPVHRFAIHAGGVREIFVALEDGHFVEVLGEPSTPFIEERLSSLGVSLPEGYRGEVNLAMAGWVTEVARVLQRGFVLTIDYGQLADELYSPENAGGTLVCHRQHAVSSDPYQQVGRQDITCHVDFTSMMRLGERHGLDTVGYTTQSRFLENLGFSSQVDALSAQGHSAARTEFNRIAMMTLVDPEEYGDLKVLAQAKGFGPAVDLQGFTD